MIVTTRRLLKEVTLPVIFVTDNEKFMLTLCQEEKTDHVTSDVSRSVKLEDNFTKWRGRNADAH